MSEPVINNTYALLDVPNLAHRNWYAIMNRPPEERVVYGVLRDLAFLAGALGTGRFLFCFDCEGVPARAAAYPAYKLNRERGESWQTVNRQIDRLREVLLPALGHENLYREVRYEADDVVGCLAAARGDHERMVIVSTDQDFYQLLDRRTSLWNPRTKKLHTQAWFRQTYGIHPYEWVAVKGLCGCRTDNVKGLCGEGRALKYVRLEPLPDAFRKKVAASQETVSLNRRLARLPYPDLPHKNFTVRPDRPSEEAWKKVVSSLGFHDLERRFPGGQV